MFLIDLYILNILNCITSGKNVFCHYSDIRYLEVQEEILSFFLYIRE